MGSRARHIQVVLPLWVRWSHSVPLATACNPAVTVTLKWYVALSLGLVVDRVPGCGRVRLTDDHGTVIGVDEPLDSRLRVTERLGNTVVPDDRAEPAALGDRPRRGDGELAAGARPGRAPSGDLDRTHGEPVQVEIERRQRLCRAGIDTRPTGQHIGRGLEVHGEVVVRDVVPPIPVVREIRIADSGPPPVSARGRVSSPGRRPAPESSRRVGQWPE
jgi:hypothetical protein